MDMRASFNQYTYFIHMFSIKTPKYKKNNLSKDYSSWISVLTNFKTRVTRKICLFILCSS